MKVGPPRGARKEKPKAKRPHLPPSSPAPAPCVVRRENPKSGSISAAPVQPHCSSPASETCSARQERADLILSDHSQPPSANPAPNPCGVPQAQQQLSEHQEQTATEAEAEAEQPISRPGLHFFAAIATNVINVAAEADQQELLSIPNIRKSMRV